MAGMKSRRDAAARCEPLESGLRDPLDGIRLPNPGPGCTLNFACLSKSIEVLQRVETCPCSPLPETRGAAA
jgi:hypothetical protein